MRVKSLSVLGVVWFLGLCGALALAKDAAPFSGRWKGSWQGGGAGGRFELTLEQAADGKWSGGVSVGQESGDYVASFESATVEAGELRARYAYTPDAQADIVLTGKLQEGGLAGAWSMVPKGQEPAQAFAAGTWKVAK